MIGFVVLWFMLLLVLVSLMLILRQLEDISDKLDWEPEIVQHPKVERSPSDPVVLMGNLDDYTGDDEDDDESPES